jgi:threonine/homoserine/homoserine lactone efflux protein
MMALFASMLVLAVVPSVSVLAVITRSATFGFIHGVFTTIGIVLGDIIFILIAVAGLALVVTAMGQLFFLIKYLGAAYLIGLGIRLCRVTPQPGETLAIAESSLLSSFLTGLLITLGDQKATLFYLGFFPAFLDISQISYIDIFTVIAIAVVAVGGVKLGYALLADRARVFIDYRTQKNMNIAAGIIMIVVGLFLIVKPA